MRRCLSATVIATLVLFCSAYAQQKPSSITIQGYVYDKGGVAVENVTVLVSPVDRVGGQVRVNTDDKGYYKLTLKPGETFDICYSHPSTGLLFLSRLSGNQDQRISKVLIRDQKNQAEISATDIFDYLQSIEYVMFQLKYDENRGVLRDYLAENKMLPELGPITMLAEHVSGPGRVGVSNKIDYLTKAYPEFR